MMKTPPFRDESQIARLENGGTALCPILSGKAMMKRWIAVGTFIQLPNVIVAPMDQ